MLRALSRTQASQSHVRRPRSTPPDHPHGAWPGGVPGGAAVPQRSHVTGRPIAAA
jgi:hypothetical protein